MAIKKTPREEKNEQNHLNIVHTANALFSEYGFERVTVEELCTQASVSKSTFYAHFGSKQDLLMSYARVDRSRFILERYTHDDTRPFKELLRDFFFANFEYNRRDPRSFSRDTYISYIKTYRQEWQEDNYYLIELKNLIERGMREHAFKQELTAQEHFHMIHDWIIGFFMGWSIHPDNAPSVDGMYDNIMNAMVDALVK